MCLAQGHNTVTPVRLEPAAPRSRVKHSTTEPLRSLDGEERAGCFALFVFLVSRDCCFALTLDATGLSAVCDCGISWSYSLTFLR